MNGNMIGIALSLVYFFRASGCGRVPSPRHSHKAATRLEAAQRTTENGPQLLTSLAAGRGADLWTGPSNRTCER